MVEVKEKESNSLRLEEISIRCGDVSYHVSEEIMDEILATMDGDGFFDYNLLYPGESDPQIMESRRRNYRPRVVLAIYSCDGEGNWLKGHKKFINLDLFKQLDKQREIIIDRETTYRTPTK